jgi:hypothetical protein
MTWFSKNEVHRSGRTVQTLPGRARPASSDGGLRIANSHRAGFTRSRNRGIGDSPAVSKGRDPQVHFLSRFFSPLAT